MNGKKPKRRMTNGDPLVKQLPERETKRKGSVFDTYYDLQTFKQRPFPYSFLVRLSEELQAWSLKDTSLRIESFYLDNGIRQLDFYRFVDRCDELKGAHEAAMQRIAIRRDQGALTKKFDSSWAARTQAAFDPEYRKARKFEAELSKEMQDNQQRVVIIERMPETKEVKEKKEE